MGNESYSPLYIFSNLDQHGRDLIKGLHQNYKDHLFTDYTIILTNGKHIACNRTVLAAKVPFFRALFTTGDSIREGSSDDIKLDHLEPYCVEALVEYCYSGCMEVPWEKIEDMVYTADFMQVTNLKKELDAFLLWKVTPNSAVEQYCFAKQFDLKQTKLFIEQNFIKEISDSKEFLELSLEELEYIIYNYIFKVDGSNARDLLVACIRWILHLPSRQRYILRILKQPEMWDGQDIKEVLQLDRIKNHPYSRVFEECVLNSEDWSNEKSRRSILVAVGKKVTEGDRCFSLWSHIRNLDSDMNAHMYAMMGETAGKWSTFKLGRIFESEFNMDGIFANSLEAYSVCSVPSGFIITGGAVNLSCQTFLQNNKYIPQPFSYYFRLVPPDVRKVRGFLLPPMSQARFFHGCEFVNNSVYVFGGYCGDPRGFPIGDNQDAKDSQTKKGTTNPRVDLSDTVVALDFERKNWTVKASMPIAVSHPASFVTGDEIYVLGAVGYSNTQPVFEKYNVSFDAWELLTIPPFMCDIHHHSGLFNNGTFYVMGNKYYRYADYDYKNEPDKEKGTYFLEYDVATNTWDKSGISEGEEYMYDTYGIDYSRSCMFMKNGLLFCLTTSHENSIWQYNEPTRTWSISNRIDVPAGFTTDGSTIFRVLEIDSTVNWVE